MKEQILTLQDINDPKLKETVLIEILALMATKLEELEGKLLATRSSVEKVLGVKRPEGEGNSGFSIG